MEKNCECYLSEMHMNAEIEYDIFSITLQLTTFRHRGKPKTILKLNWSVRLNCKLFIKKLLQKVVFSW
jgi:hypothetical protein